MEMDMNRDKIEERMDNPSYSLAQDFEDELLAKMEADEKKAELEAELGASQFNVEEALARLVAQVVAMPPEKRADYLKNEWGLNDDEVASLLEDVAAVENADNVADTNVTAEGIKSGNISDSLDRIASDQDNELEEKAAKMAGSDGTDVTVTESDTDGDGDVDKAEIKKEKPEDDSKNSEAEDKPHDKDLTDEQIDEAYAKANGNKTNQFARHLNGLRGPGVE